MLEYYKFKTVHELFMKGLEEEAKEQLAQLQRHYVALCDENTTFRMQVQEYEDILYLARNLFYDGHFYWLTTGSIKQGPFCPVCYDRDGLLMRLAGERHERHCPSCRKDFKNITAPMEQIARHTYEKEEEYAACARPAEGRAKVIRFSR